MVSNLRDGHDLDEEMTQASNSHGFGAARAEAVTAVEELRDELRAGRLAA